jgi:hypothetical protein
MVIYTGISIFLTKSLFLNAPDGEFFNAEENVTGWIDWFSRIEFINIIIILIPFIFVSAILGEIFLLFLRRLKKRRGVK